MGWSYSELFEDFIPKDGWEYNCEVGDDISSGIRFYRVNILGRLSKEMEIVDEHSCFIQSRQMATDLLHSMLTEDNKREILPEKPMIVVSHMMVKNFWDKIYHAEFIVVLDSYPCKKELSNILLDPV